MFRPHKGICVCHEQERWILNKKGECQYGINERKKNSDKRTKTIPSLIRRSWRPKDYAEKPNRIPSKALQRTASKIKKTPLAKKRKKATGERVLFIEIWTEACEIAYPDCPRCRCCQAPLGIEPKPIFFSHLLSKGAYPAFRLLKENIWLCCADCHGAWETASKFQERFTAKRLQFDKLKQLYYARRRNV